MNDNLVISTEALENAIGYAGKVNNVPADRLNEWSFYLRLDDGSLYHLNLKDVAAKLKTSSLGVFALSNCGGNGTPGGAGIFAHGMIDGLNYPVMYAGEAGGTSTILYAVLGGMLYIGAQKKMRPLVHNPVDGSKLPQVEVVRGFMDFARLAENALAELEEEAGRFKVGVLDLVIIGTENYNNSRAHTGNGPMDGFVHLAAEIAPDDLEMIRPSVYALKETVFTEATDKETLTLRPLEFYPAFGINSPFNGMDKGQPKEGFSVAGIYFLLNYLILQGRAHIQL